MKTGNVRFIKCLFVAFVLAFTGLLLNSCNSTKSKIDEKCRSGVVLIVNQYYYTLTLSNGVVFYFSGDGSGNITDFAVDANSASSCLTTVTGTGFFISNDGLIATNRHVASRTVKDNDVVKFTKKILNSVSLYLEQENDTCMAIMDQCRERYKFSTDKDEKKVWAKLYDSMDQQVKENNETIRTLKYMDPQDAEIEYHSSLSVAYNGTYVKTTDDLYPCVLRNVAEEESKDLAVIQLNSKQTPSNVYVFPVPSKNMLEHYSFGEYLSKLFGSDKNEELYMIGFNRGFSIAPTDVGIYSQCTDGSISRDEKDRILYSINSLPGSSGSPVLNRRGQLVAINYLGLKDDQGFNWGVKEQFLYELIQK